MGAFNREAYEADGRWLGLTYECDCGCMWTDEWSCEVDDDCPDCGASCTPSAADEIMIDEA